LPMPWGYNVFHVLGQVMGETLMSRKRDIGKSLLRLGGSILDAFNPLGNQSTLYQLISPTISDPAVMWLENKDWSGRKIRPDQPGFGPQKPSSQLYWNSVKPTSKWITDQINSLTGGDEIKPGKISISPEALDLVFDQIVGSAGKVIGDTLMLPVKLMSPTKELETYEIPFLRRVYGKPGNQAISQQFYESMDKVRMAVSQYKHYVDDPEKVAEIKKDNRHELKLQGYMSYTERLMEGIRKEQRSLVEKPDNDRKTERLVELEKRKLKAMKAFNKAYEE
jgi:hypothetical protein